MSDERLLELIENKNKDYMLGFIKGIININKELHKQLEQLKENNRKYQEVIDKVKELLGNYKHYSTPSEKQNSDNENLVNKAFDLLKEVE